MKRILSFVLAFVLMSSVAFAADTPRTPAVYPLEKDAIMFTWSALDGDDTGIPVSVAACKSLTYHIYSSTYGSSTITIEGSNDPLAGGTSYASAEYVGLSNVGNTTISKTSDALDSIQQLPRFIRPKTASGTSANISVGILCQR